MVIKLIEDIKKCLDNNIYLSALLTALTLPDICGKAEYPTDKPNDRYIKWYNEYIGQYETTKFAEDEGMPYASGIVIYNLRNSLIHSGNPNINEKTCDIQEFELLIEEKNQFNIYVGSSGITERYMLDGTKKTTKSLCINVRQLCLKLSRAAEYYYNNNKEKFDFFNSKLTYWNPQARKVFFGGNK